MFFYYNASGDILSAIFDETYQGSNNANTIYFACPTAKTNAVSVAFTLPDGSNTQRRIMRAENSEDLNGVFDEEGNAFNVWKYKLPSAITEKRGTVHVQFYISAPDDTTVATAAVDFTVRRGVPGNAPQEGDAYEELVSLMSEYSARMDDAEEDIAEKLTKRITDGIFVNTAVYAYNQYGQKEIKVSDYGSTNPEHIPLYNANGNLITSAPVDGTDSANKNYVDTNFGKTLELSVDNSTFVLTLNLKNADGTVISTGSVDLPIESVVVDGSFDSVNKRLILSLQSGNVINVPVGSLISGLLEERNNDGTTTALYAFCGNTQTYKNVSATPLGGAVAEYGAGGTLKTNAPQAGTDAVNKTYADDNFGTTVITDDVSSSVSLVPAKNTEYYYGELDELNLSFGTGGVNAGDTFYITFESGETATALTVNYTNASVERAIEASANCVVEVSAVFNGSKWLIAWRQL